LRGRHPAARRADDAQAARPGVGLGRGREAGSRACASASSSSTSWRRWPSSTRCAALAEEEAHHPDFCVHYNRVDVTLWTHAVGGLSENDFILAAKIDGILA
jgi:hypothetical protein